MLDEIKPRADGRSYSDQIAFVKDRPGHDFRYAINAEKIRRDFGWKPTHSLASGLHDTICWYLANDGWLETIQSRSYKDWYELNTLNLALRMKNERHCFRPFRSIGNKAEGIFGRTRLFLLKPGRRNVIALLGFPKDSFRTITRFQSKEH